jgi:hypothetical protein
MVEIPRKDAKKGKILKRQQWKSNQQEQTQDNPIKVNIPTGSMVSLADIKSKIN